MEDASNHLEILMKPVLEAEQAVRDRRIRKLMQQQDAQDELDIEPAAGGSTRAAATV
jgi:hypothetical protein